MHVEVKQLGTAIRTVLDRINYRRADIRVEARERVDVGVAGGDGMRGFAYVVNLDTGAFDGQQGSWGGQNMFTRGSVDDGEVIELPDNAAVIKGTRGHGGVFATLYVNPAAMRQLPSGEAEEELSHEEKQALYCFVSIKGGEYRREEMRRRNVSETTVDSLVDRGYLKRNKAGATQATTKGKNAATVRY